MPPGASPPPPRARRGTGSRSARPPRAPARTATSGRSSSTSSAALAQQRSPRPTKAAVSDRNAPPREPRDERARPPAARRRPPAAHRGTRPLRRAAARANCVRRDPPHPATVMAVMRRAVRPCGMPCSRSPRRPRRWRRASPPRERTLSSGWEMRVEAAAPAPPQEAPPEETAPEGAPPAAPATAGRPRRAGAGRLAAHARAERVRRPRPAVALSRPGAPLPRELPGPAHPARVQLAAALRERAPQRGRDPERAPHRPQRRPLHAVHARGPRPAPRPHATSSW